MLNTKNTDPTMVRVAKGMRGYLDWSARLRGFADNEDRERNEPRAAKLSKPPRVPEKGPQVIKDWLSLRRAIDNRDR